MTSETPLAGKCICGSLAEKHFFGFFAHCLSATIFAYIQSADNCRSLSNRFEPGLQFGKIFQLQTLPPVPVLAR